MYALEIYYWSEKNPPKRKGKRFNEQTFLYTHQLRPMIKEKLLKEINDHIKQGWMVDDLFIEAARLVKKSKKANQYLALQIIELQNDKFVEL